MKDNTRMTRFQKRQAELKQNGYSTKFFTTAFYRRFERDYLSHLYGLGNYENVKQTNFYQKNSASYCEFLSLYSIAKKGYDVELQLRNDNGEIIGKKILKRGDMETFVWKDVLEATVLVLLEDNEKWRLVLETNAENPIPRDQYGKDRYNFDCFLLDSRSREQGQTDYRLYSFSDLKALYQKKEEKRTKYQALVDEMFPLPKKEKER